MLYFPCFYCQNYDLSVFGSILFHIGKIDKYFHLFKQVLPLSRPKPLQGKSYHTRTRTRTGTRTQAHRHTQPLTWQHDIKSQPQREQIDGSTIR